MFRKPSGKLGFSLGRVVKAPQFSTASPPGEADADLTATQKDDLVRFQLSLPDPRLLVEESFYIVHVTESVDRSRYVHKKLQEMSILSSHPADTTVYTSRINKDFRNQLALIPGQRQRLLVGMLFWWEEELARLAALDMEERDLLMQLDGVASGSAAAESLRIGLAMIERKRRMLPSERGRDSATTAVHTLPGYGQSAGTVEVPHVTGRATDRERDLPSYGDYAAGSN